MALVMLGAGPTVARAQDEPTEPAFWILAWPSALDTPLHRLRVRLFHHALRYLFANNGTTYASRSTECSRNHQMPRADLWHAAHCDVSPDIPDEVAAHYLPHTSPDDTPGPDIAIILYSETEPPERYEEFDEVVRIDVSTMRSSELAMRACELARAQRSIRCEMPDEPQPLGHPRDDLLIVEEQHDGSYAARKVTWQGRNDRLLFRGPTETEDFVVQAFVQWEMPQPELRMGIFETEGVPQEAYIDTDGELDWLLRRRVLRLSATLDGAAMRPQPRIHRTGIRLALPEVDDGTHRIEARVESPRPEDPDVTAHLVWTHVTAHAGAFFQCFAPNADFPDQGGLLVRLRGQWCMVAPWWSEPVAFFRVDEEPDVILTGTVAHDPALPAFVALILLLVLLVRLVVTREARPTHLAYRIGTRASYRNAPVSAWCVHSLGEELKESPLRIVSTPFGTWGLSWAPLWTRRGQSLLDRRRVIPLVPGTLVVGEDVQLLFLAQGEADDLEAEFLERALTTKEELELAPAEAEMASYLATRGRLSRAVSVLGVAFGVCVLALGAAYTAGLLEPLLSQRLPFLGITVVALPIVHVVVHKLVSRFTRR